MKGRFIKLILKYPQFRRIITFLFLKGYWIHKKIDCKIDSKIAKFTTEANFPPMIHPENLNYCNSKCIMCPQPTMKREKGYMDSVLYKRIIDESSINNIKSLKLFMYGEPLLDSGLAQKIWYAKEKGIPFVYLSTNGQLLDKNKGEELIKAGVDHINVSFDGVTKKTFEGIRQGLNFEVIEKNIKDLMDTKKQLNSNTPQVVVQIITMEENKKEIGAFIKKWRGIVDGTKVERYHDYSGQQIIKSNKAIIKQTLKRLPCEWLWNKCTILWNGDVSFCCMDVEAKVVVGNVNDNSIEEVWNSKKMQDLRKKHIEGNFDEIELCKNCKYYDEINLQTRMEGYLKYFFKVKKKKK